MALSKAQQQLQDEYLAQVQQKSVLKEDTAPAGIGIKLFYIYYQPYRGYMYDRPEPYRQDLNKAILKQIKFGKNVFKSGNAHKYTEACVELPRVKVFYSAMASAIAKRNKTLC